MYILYSIYPQICNFSLIACYSLEFTLCLLLVVVHSLLVTRWRSLFAWYSLEFTLCLVLVGVHTLLVTRWSSHFACYSLEFTPCLLLVGVYSLLVTRWSSLFACYSLEFTLCLLLVGVHSLLVMRCKICCSLQNSLSTPAEELCMLQKITHYSSPDLLNVKCKASLIFKVALTGLRQIFGN